MSSNFKSDFGDLVREYGELVIYIVTTLDGFLSLLIVLMGIVSLPIWYVPYVVHFRGKK